MDASTLAIYGAGLSTIGLSWAIWKNLRETRGRIRVDLEWALEETLDSDFHSSLGMKQFLAITLTNVGHTSRHLDGRPVLRCSRTKLGFLEFFEDEGSPPSFPHELKPGEAFKVKVDAKKIYGERLLSFGLAARVWAEARDTHRRRYRSRKIRVGEVRKFVEDLFSDQPQSKEPPEPSSA